MEEEGDEGEGGGLHGCGDLFLMKGGFLCFVFKGQVQGLCDEDGGE